MLSGFFFSSRRRHTRWPRDWSSDVCSSDLVFLEKKVEREALEVSKQQKHENLLRRELAWIRRGARARSTKQRARVERVEALQEKKHHQTHRSLDMKVGATRLGKQVLELENISKSFAGKRILTGFSHLFKRGDKVGIIGPNGSGKTTR